MISPGDAAGAVCLHIRRRIGRRQRVLPIGLRRRATTSSVPPTARTEKHSRTVARKQLQRPSEATISSPPAGGRDISFDTIKFDMQKEEPFQRQLITASDRKTRQHQDSHPRIYFAQLSANRPVAVVLVRDNMQCCFGPGAALYDCIVGANGGKPYGRIHKPSLWRSKVVFFHSGN